MSIRFSNNIMTHLKYLHILLVVVSPSKVRKYQSPSRLLFYCVMKKFANTN